MAILGNNTTPSSGYFYDDFGNNQFGCGYVMPAGGGTVSQIDVYCAGDGVSPTAQLVFWWSGGYWASGNFTLASGSRSVGGQGWRTFAVPNIYVPAGALNIGFWSSGNVVWTFEASGGTNYQRSVSGGPASTFTSGGTEGSGALGAYLTYTPLPAPTLSGASPNYGVAGNTTVVTGTNLLHTSGVTLGGAAASFAINSDTQLTVTVPGGAATGAGSVVVTTPAGTASTSYYVVTAPTISSATPNVGTTGTAIIVAGTGFTDTTGVTINGAAATFTVNSNTQITTSVPSGAAAGVGTLVVTNAAGTASTAFTIGTIYADNIGTYVGGVLIYADDGAAWQACTVYADNGSTWVQIS